MTEKQKQEFLRMICEQGALKIAKNKNEFFTFKSGRKSPNFINIGSLTDGESLHVLKKAYVEKICELLEKKEIEDFDFIFGPAYKGIPLAALVCEGLAEKGIKKRFIYDRKSEKAYGDVSSDKILVGAMHFFSGARVLVIDDVITTGQAKFDAIEKLKVLGKSKIVGIIVAIDRQERGGDAENISKEGVEKIIKRKYGISLHSIANMEDVFTYVKKDLSPEIKRAWIEYYKKYGIKETKTWAK